MPGEKHGKPEQITHDDLNKAARAANMSPQDAKNIADAEGLKCGRKNEGLMGPDFGIFSFSTSLGFSAFYRIPGCRLKLKGASSTSGLNATYLLPPRAFPISAPAILVSGLPVMQ